jgi:hypothetical protein
MLIRPSLPLTAKLANTQTPRPKNDAPPTFKETALAKTIVGASVGCVIGERVGGVGLVGGAGYLGWKVGQGLGGTVGGAIGAAVGAGATLLVETKVFPVGRTAGAIGGFLAGGIVGGVAGCAIGGVQAIANSNLFK